MVESASDYIKKYGAPTVKQEQSSTSSIPTNMAKYIQKYGNPTDTRIVKDSQGNMVGHVQVGSDAYKYLSQGRSVYQKDSGELTVDAPTATIELDKKTGKITLNNTPASLTGERLEKVIDNLGLKDLSAAYKANKNAAFPKSDGSGETVTVEEIIESYNKPNETTGLNALNTYGKQYQNVDDIVYELMSSHNVIGENGQIKSINFTDTDILSYQTNLQALKTLKETSTDKLTDDTRIVIDKSFAEQFGLDKMNSAVEFDETTITLGVKDFMENYYTRKKSDWESKQEVDPTTGSENLGLFIALKDYITGQSGQVNGVDEKGNPITVFTHRDDKTQNLATAISLYTLLADTDPVCSFWQGAGDITASAINGIEDALEKVGEAGAVMITLAADGIVAAGDYVFNRPQLGEDKEYKLDKNILPSHMLAKWAGYGDNRSFYAVSDTVRTQGIEALQADISKYNSAAQGVFVAAEFLTEMAIMISVGNAFANGAKALLAKGASAASRGAALFGNAQSLTNGLSTTWQLTGNASKAAATTLNVVAKAMQWKGTTAAVSILAETAGEALIQNPSLTGQILSGETLSPEAQEFVWSNVLGNAGGFTGGHALSKGLVKLGDTTIGKAVSRNFNRLIWTVSNWAGDTSDSIRVFFSNEDNIYDIINKGNPNKIDARMAKRIVRAGKELVLENTDSIKILGMSSDEIIEQVAKYDDELSKYMTIENALDYMATRGTYTATAFLADPNSSLNGAYKEYSKIQSELLDISKKAGYVGSKAGEYSVLPTKVKDYITTKQHLDILNAYSRAISNGFDVGESLSAIQKEIEHFQPILATLTNELPDNIIAKSDEFITANRNLWTAWTDYRIDKGLLDADMIEALRKSEQWGIEGNLYVGQMRQMDTPKYRVQRADNLRDINATEELGRYKFGSTQGFVDPILTFQSSLLSSAQKYDRQLVLRQFRGTEMVSTKYTAEQMRLVQSVNKGRKALNAGIDEAFAGAVENIRVGTIIDSVGDLQLKGNQLTFVAKELAEGGAVREIDDMVDGFYNLLSTGNTKVNNMLDALITEYAPDAEDAARKVLVYGALEDRIDSLGKKVYDGVLKEFETRTIDGKTLSVKQAKEIANDITERFKDNIKTRFDYNRVELSRAGEKAKTLIDQEKWNKEIRDLAQEMGDAQSANPNIITVQDEFGRIEMVEVDPLLANFMTTAGKTAQMSDSMLAKINYAWMRVFRFGTTGPNPVSWVNQFFRDFGNAWLVGGATKTVMQATDIIADAFGSNPALYMSEFSEQFIAEAQEKAIAQGKGLGRIIAESEVEYGQEIVGKQTEKEALNAYNRLKNERYVNGQIQTSTMKRGAEAVDRAMQKADFVNNAREEWLRGRVYANNYAKAIQSGKTISQARTWAEFYSSNATTNFSRATTFLSGIQNTVPYLRSAINGTKSFWRLWQVDPVGVTGRIVGGLVLPMMGMMSLSLNSEENRNVYKNIKEYQKDTSLAFVVEGQAFFVPIPQEVATVIAPVRQIMESIFDVNTNSFSEIAFSDVLALSPVDLSGFADLDNYKIYDEGFWERMGSGTTKLAAQILPKYANTLVAIATNRDLYTGNKIDTSYTTIDPDTGEARVMDYSSGQFAKWLNKLFPNISAAMAENILKNTIGQVGIGMGNWIVDMTMSAIGQQDWSQTGENIVSGLAGAVISPFTNYIPYDEADVAWRQAVSQTYQVKNDLLASDEYKQYLRLANNATSEKDINAAAVARTNIVEKYYDQVKAMVDGYTQNYGRGLTQAQLASTISLMVLHQDTDTGNAMLKQANTDAYNASRASALATMNRMGFANVGADDAIFGRIRTNSATGEIYVEYNNPIAILDYKKMQSISDEVHQINMKNLLEDAGLTTYAKSQGYKEQKTSAQKKQYKKDWNAKVVKVLQPYISQYGLETVLDDWGTAEVLDDYIYTDTYYNAKQYVTKVFTGK